MTTSPQATPVLSLVNEDPTGIDARIAYKHLNHGDSWRMARLGARDLMRDERAGYLQFDVRITRKLRVVVKLAMDDTYSVELGRMRRPRGVALAEYEVLEQLRGIHADQLGETVERMCVVWSGPR